MKAKGKRRQQEIAINKKWGLYQSPNKKGESVNPPYQVYAVFSCGKNFNQSLKNVYRPARPVNALDGSCTINYY
jgi:hypothetical protein